MFNENKKLTPQAKKILDILLDRLWHCGIDWHFADGHTKRFTDINRFLANQGLKIESAWCDCGRHTTRILKRRIVQTEEWWRLPKYQKKEILRIKQGILL